MPDLIARFDYPHIVVTDEIDELGHAGNYHYIRWMQHAAVAHSSANGWGARSHSNSYARTVGGFARSDSNAVANGNWANARSNADTRTWGTYGSSSSEAIDNRATNYPVYNGYPTATPAYNGGNYSSGTSAAIFQNSTPRATILRGRTVRRGW